jgi:hypothetical protein
MNHQPLRRFQRRIMTLVSKLAGPPARRIARFKICTVKLDAFLELGWGLKTTAFPAETIAMLLQITVLVGLVLGVSEPMMP